MPKVRELLTRWVFKSDTKALKRFEAGLTAAKKTATVAAKAVAAVAGVASAAGLGLLALTKRTAESDDALGKLSQKIGVSVEDLSGLRYAADLADVGLSDLQMGFKGLADKAAGAARKEKGALDLFKRLGISATDSAGKMKNPVMLFYEVAESLKDAPSAVERSSRAIDVFGRSGLSLIPMLKDGAMGVAKLQAEARKAGLVIGKDATDAAEEFNDSITALKALVFGTAASLTRSLVPGLTSTIKRAREWVLANQGLIRGKIVEYIKMIKDIIIELPQKFMDVVKTVRSVIQALDRLKYVIIGLMALQIIAMLKSLALTLGVTVLSSIVTIIQVLGVLKAAAVFLVSAIGLVGMLAASIAYLVSNWDEVASGWGEVWDSLVATTRQAINAIKKAIGPELWGWLFGGEIATPRVMLTMENMQRLRGVAEGPTIQGGRTATTNIGPTVNAPINVTVPPGTPAEQARGVAKAARDGVRQASNRAALEGVKR